MLNPTQNCPFSHRIVVVVVGWVIREIPWTIQKIWNFYILIRRFYPTLQPWVNPQKSNIYYQYQVSFWHFYILYIICFTLLCCFLLHCSLRHCSLLHCSLPLPNHKGLQNCKTCLLKALNLKAHILQIHTLKGLTPWCLTPWCLTPWCLKLHYSYKH